MKREVTDAREIDEKTEQLPGDIRFHLKELRKNKGWSIKEAAEALSVGERTYKRMESDHEEDRKKDIDCSVIVRAAEIYDVSVEYLLGLTTIPFRTTPLVEQLQLSEKSLGKLVDESLDHEVLNKVIEHPRFHYLLWYASCFVHGRAAAGFSQFNEFMKSGAGELQKLKRTMPDKSDELQEGIFGLDSMMVRVPSEGEENAAVEEYRHILKDVRKENSEKSAKSVPITGREMMAAVDKLKKQKQEGARVNLADSIMEVLSILNIKNPLRDVQNPLLDIQAGKDSSGAAQIIITLPKTDQEVMAALEEISKGLPEINEQVSAHIGTSDGNS